AGGLILLAFADNNRVGFILGGTVTTAIGILFLSPLAIRILASAAGRTPIAVRLALRDLARYQARSGAALGAVTLSIGIAATIAIAAAAAQNPAGAGNLSRDQLMLYLSPAGGLSQIPPTDISLQHDLNNAVDRLAAAIHADSVLPLDQAYIPGSTIQPAQPGSVGGGSQPAGYVTTSMVKVLHGGHEITSPVALYVADPAVLAYFKINPSQIDAATDVVTSRHDLVGEQIFSPIDFTRDQSPPRRSSGISQPAVQVVKQLPLYTSAPSALITSRAMQELGLESIPAGWLVQSHGPLTSAQIAIARQAAAAAGLYVEIRTTQQSLAQLRNWSTAAGVLLALGVLAMTVGLIRAETVNDLRTLTATGASPTTRRALTGATACALAFLGALLGTAGAYCALLAWYRSDLTPLGQIPLANLIVILVGLPAIATMAGWLLAGREPSAINRRPIE
ncbi:MAG: hypothetical protein JO337_06665, partial [Acidimicrobiales bacterium]|nr:hypothetical protein [Acidimicrobiales bacterium]